MIPCAGTVARSRNLGQALFGSPVCYETESESGSGIPKRLKIRPQIRMQGWNHNTCCDSDFYRIRNHQKAENMITDPFLMRRGLTRTFGFLANVARAHATQPTRFCSTPWNWGESPKNQQPTSSHYISCFRPHYVNVNGSMLQIIRTIEGRVSFHKYCGKKTVTTYRALSNRYDWRILWQWFLAEITAVTVSLVMADIVTSPVTKSSLVRSPVKELSPVKLF